MSEFFPQDVTQTALTAIDQSVKQLPFSAGDLNNQLSQLNQVGTNAVVTQINNTLADANALINQQLPFPAKKLVTFYLLDRNGNLVEPIDKSFQKGYLFNMYINPSNFNINYPAKQINEIRTMGGWVIQHWYPNIGSIEMDGIIGNLLQRYNTDVKKTPAWDGFKNLLRVYLNNGIPYSQNKGLRGTRQFNPIAVCTYDHVSYHGYFESFSFQESQDNPFTRNYAITFKFVNMIDVQDIVELTRDKVSSTVNQILQAPTSPITSTINNFITTTNGVS